MWVPKITLLIGLVAVSLVQATKPASSSQGGESSVDEPDNYKWAVTYLKLGGPDPERPGQHRLLAHGTGSSDDYLKHVQERDLRDAKLYNLLQRHEKEGNLEELKRILAGRFHRGEINQVEYSILLDNELQRMTALQMVKNKGAIQIADTIHHHESLDPNTVISDWKQNKIPKMSFAPTENVRGDLKSMMILQPPPPRPDSTVTSSSRDKKKWPVVSTYDPTAEISWHVTTPIQQQGEGQEPQYRTETIRHHLERLDREKKGEIFGVDFPEKNELYLPLMTPELEEQYKKMGYSEQGIKDIIHNRHQNRLAYRFIRAGGAVRYPYGIHHPLKTPLSKALLSGEDVLRTAHMNVVHKTEIGRPRRRLQFHHWMPGSNDYQSSSEVSSEKRPLESTSHGTV